MAATPKLKFHVEVTGKQLTNLTADIKHLASYVSRSSTKISNSTIEIQQSLNGLKSTSKTVASVVNKNFASIQTSITRVADHTTKQLTKITSASISAHNKMGAAAERNLNKVAKGYENAMKSAKTADASISASAKQIKKNAEDMMKGTAKFGGKLASALKTIEDKLEQVLKGIQAMSRSAATAAKNATKAIKAHEKQLKSAGKTARDETRAQERVYRAYGAGIEALFKPHTYEQRSLSNLIKQRKQFNTLLRQTAVRGGMPGLLENASKYKKGDKLPQLPFGKLDNTSLMSWAKNEEITFRKAMSNADMLKLKWGQLAAPLDGLSRKLLDTGRNMRWIGQNLLMTFSVPLFMAARKTTQLYLSVAQEYTRIQKVAGLQLNSKNAEKQARDLKTFQRIKADISQGVSRYGISQKSQAALFGDIVAMGYSADKAAQSIRGMNTEAGQMADEIMRTATLGDIGIKTATDFYRTMLKVFVSAQPGVKTFSDTIQGTNFIVDQLNQIENKTSINLNQLADAMPTAAGAAKLFGMKAAELASILTGLYDKGIAVNTAATGINFSLTRILAPTKKASEVFDAAFGAGALQGVQNIGGGMERLITLSEMYRKMLETQGKVKVTQVFSELVSKRQIKTFEPLVSSINEGTDQVRAALQAMPDAVEMASKKKIDIANAPFYDLVPLMSKFRDDLLQGTAGAEGVTNGYIRSLIAANAWATDTTENVDQLAKKLQTLSAREIDIKLKSDPIRYQIMLQTIKMLGAEIGQFLFPMLIKVTGVVKKLVEGLNNLAPSTKSLLAGLAVALASFGPVAITIGSFRSVLGFVGKTIGFVLPKLNMMSKEALLLAVNMGNLNLANSTVIKTGENMAAVIDNNQNMLSKFFLRLKGIKLEDIAANEALAASERDLAVAKGQATTAAEAQQIAESNVSKQKAASILTNKPKAPLLDRLLGRTPASTGVGGKSPIARRILGRGGPRKSMPKGFIETIDPFEEIRQRYAGMAAEASQVPLGGSVEAEARRTLVTELGQALGLQAPKKSKVTVGAGKGRGRSGKRRGRRVLPSLPEYLDERRYARGQDISAQLMSLHDASPYVKQKEKLRSVAEAAQRGDFGPLEEYFRKTSSTQRAKLAPILQSAQSPLDIGIPQGVEPRQSLSQRLRGRIFGRKSAATKAAEALAANIASGAEAGTAIPVGGAAGGALQNVVEQSNVKKQFKEIRKVYTKGLREIAFTPAKEITRQVSRPLRALAFGTELATDEQTGETYRRRKRGLSRNRLFEGARRIRSIGMRDIIGEDGTVTGRESKLRSVGRFIKDKGGIRGALSAKETTDKFKMVKEGAVGALKLFTQFGIYTPIIIAIGAAIFLIAKNWDKVYKAMAPGVKAIKEAWNKLLESFKGVGKIFGKAFGSLSGEAKKGEDSITSPFDAVGQVLSSLLEVISALVEAIAALITKMAPVFRWLADIMKNSFGFLINLIKMIAKLLKGDFSEAWGYAKMAIGYFLKFILSIYRPILSVFSAIAKIVLKTIGTILNAASHLPGIGKYAAKARDAINNMANGFDLERILGKQIDNVFMKDREIQATAVAGETIYKPNKRGTDNKQTREPDTSGDGATDDTKNTADKMANIWDNFLSTLKSKLDETINELKDTLNKSFAKVWEERLKVYDDQIKAIDDLENKEEELLATQEYVQNRREALNKRSLDQQNYVRNRALAIYEGRIDDARMLDLEFSQTNASNNKAITDLDNSRARDLLKKERDLQRQRIQQAKSAAEEWMKVEEENFKKQIDLITQYTPRTDAEWRTMMDTINSTIANYGMPAITGSFMDGMAIFQTASDNAKNEILASGFWSGEWIDTSILSWISQLSGIPLQNLVKAASDAGSTAGQAFTDGYNDSLPENAPQVLTKKEKAVMNWNAALDWNQKVKDFNANPANQQELANAFQGWGPASPSTTPAAFAPGQGPMGEFGIGAPSGVTPPTGNFVPAAGPAGPSLPDQFKFQQKLQSQLRKWSNKGFQLVKLVNYKPGDANADYKDAGSGALFFVSKDGEITRKDPLTVARNRWNRANPFGPMDVRGPQGESDPGLGPAGPSTPRRPVGPGGVTGPRLNPPQRNQTADKASANKDAREVAQTYTKSHNDEIRVKNSTVKQRLRDFGKAAVEGHKDALEIASPSKVAQRIARNYVNSFANTLQSDESKSKLKAALDILVSPLLNVERKGKLYIDFDITTGGIRSGIEQRLNEIFGTEIRFKTPKFLIDIANMFKNLIAGTRAYVKLLDIGIGKPNNGPNVTALEGYLGSPIPGFARGGIVKRRRGGKIVRVGEGRHDEAIVPINKKNKQLINSLLSPAAARSAVIDNYVSQHGYSAEEFNQLSPEKQNKMKVKALAAPLLKFLNKGEKHPFFLKFYNPKNKPGAAGALAFATPILYGNTYTKRNPKSPININTQYIDLLANNPLGLATMIAHEAGHYKMGKLGKVVPAADGDVYGGYTPWAGNKLLGKFKNKFNKLPYAKEYYSGVVFGEQYAQSYANSLGLEDKTFRYGYGNILTPEHLLWLRKFSKGKNAIFDKGILSKSLLDFYNSPMSSSIYMPSMAAGGLVKKRPGGILANIGEGRYDEAVIPLPKGLKDFTTSFRASGASMRNFEGSMQSAMVSALKECAPYMSSEESGGVNIYVDNFIGQPQWFESMMTEYGVKVAPNKQRSYGTMNRKVTSYQDNSSRTGRI